MDKSLEPFSKEEIKEKLADLPSGWVFDDKDILITKRFSFSDFLSAIAFVNRLTPICEKNNHHPDIHIFYNEVRFDLSTHDAGGVTEKDFNLAGEIEKKFNKKARTPSGIRASLLNYLSVILCFYFCSFFELIWR